MQKSSGSSFFVDINIDFDTLSTLTLESNFWNENKREYFENISTIQMKKKKTNPFQMLKKFG